MFTLFSKSLFLIAHIPIAFAWPVDEQQSKTDDMCGIIRNVLSVEDVLKDIATTAKSIDRKANEIQKYIENEIPIVDTLDDYVNREMDYIGSQLPTSKYHVQFFQLSNIDKKYLGHLFLEANHAMSFYYNSIEDILNMNDIFGSTTNSWLREINFSLRNEIICPYRSILNVYSYEWPSTNQSNRIEFSKRKHRNARSLVYRAHLIVVTQLLSEWMERLDSVIGSLKRKFL